MKKITNCDSIPNKISSFRSFFNLTEMERNLNEWLFKSNTIRTKHCLQQSNDVKLSEETKLGLHALIRVGVKKSVKHNLVKIRAYARTPFSLKSHFISRLQDCQRIKDNWSNYYEKHIHAQMEYHSKGSYFTVLMNETLMLI